MSVLSSPSVPVARAAMIALWYVSALSCIAMILSLYVRGWIEQDTLVTSLASINKLYIAYLGVMSAYIYGTRRQVDEAQSAPAASFWLAITGSLAWNGILLSLLIGVCLDKGKIEDSVKLGGDLCSLFSWLVGPAVGFYFASEPKR